MVAGFSVLSLALDAQTDIVTTQRIVSDVELKKQQERFGIAVSTDSTNKLDISVTNLGQNPVEISSFWIINKTLSTQPATRYSVNYDDSFVTGGIPSSILSSQSLFMLPDSNDIKVMSSLGTIEIAELVVGPSGSSANDLRSVLVTDPPDVILGQNVTIGMIVTNTGQLKINNVSPDGISVNPPGAVIASSGPNLSSVDLIPGESFLFLWDYTIDGTADTNVDFSNFATGLDVNNNMIQSNVASDASVLRESANGTSSIINAASSQMQLQIFTGGLVDVVKVDDPIEFKLFVDDENAESVPGSSIKIITKGDAVISPEVVMTSSDGSAIVSLTAFEGPNISFDIIATAEGYAEGKDSFTVNVDSPDKTFNGIDLELPEWIVYLVIGGILMIGVVVFMFLKKSKADLEEDWEEEEEI